MPFNATAVGVLMASPSDLAEEREAATMTLNDPNAQPAAAVGIVLLPVEWKHTRAQESSLPDRT